ncbi:MAG TPA: efflux transporter outer membrane subunit [Povalibacter sp.]|uniref:efflux transporter outer membrane subunit n=1 Tax=Povalibacter sp. TaxID=1962978 RepID=UPI002BA76685|nr:efflux transporter outer membrane subunit [Povalibacter sp.]HMN46453.1 efflux transporter outer membrane subunit [Povalibacter sp.]
MLTRKFLLAASSLCIAACAVGPSFEPPQAQLPEQWQGAADVQSVDAEWWKQFGDPTLDALIGRARAGNLDLKIAGLRVAQSRVQRAIATGERWPGVSANAGYQRRRESEFGVTTRMIDILAPAGAARDQIIEALAEPYDVYQAGFDAAWELDLWGRVRRAVESADANVAAGQEAFHDVELTLVAEVARTYLELRGVRDQLRIARDDVASGTDELELTGYRVKGGLVSNLDLSTQQAQVATVRSQIPPLEHQEAALQNALALLVGADPASLNAELASTPATNALPQVAPGGIPSELARRRPDIRRAEAQLHAATADIGVAVADLYPRLSITGSFSQQSLDASDFGDWGARQWVIGPSLTLPIFQGGRLRSVVELRELQQQEAAVNYQRTVLGAWHEIENALAAYAAEQRRHQELAQVVAASRDAYEIAHVRYEHGLVNYLVDLDAHRSLLQAERAFSESRTQIGVRLVALYKALGGGWSEGQ